MLERLRDKPAAIMEDFEFRWLHDNAIELWHQKLEELYDPHKAEREAREKAEAEEKQRRVNPAPGPNTPPPKPPPDPAIQREFSELCKIVKSGEPLSESQWGRLKELGAKTGYFAKAITYQEMLEIYDSIIDTSHGGIVKAIQAVDKALKEHREPEGGPITQALYTFMQGYEERIIGLKADLNMLFRRVQELEEHSEHLLDRMDAIITAQSVNQRRVN